MTKRTALQTMIGQLADLTRPELVTLRSRIDDLLEVMGEAETVDRDSPDEPQPRRTGKLCPFCSTQNVVSLGVVTGWPSPTPVFRCLSCGKEWQTDDQGQP